MIRPLSVLFLCFFISCTNKNGVPRDILPKDKMQKVMWDIIQADQFSKQFLAKDSSKNINIENMQLYDEVFQVHHISKEDFKKSFQFYISRPDIFKIVLDSLSAQASRRMNEVYKPITPSSNPKLRTAIPK